MREQASMTQDFKDIWKAPVKVDDIPESGTRLVLTANEEIRAALAKLARVEAILELEASFEVSRHGSKGLKVTGRVLAKVRQICVVSLEPIENEIDEPVDIVFLPAGTAVAAAAADIDVDTDVNELPETLIDGVADLGAIATEFLMLGIDPYPRKPGMIFTQPASDSDQSGPFASLAALKKKHNKND